MISIEAEKPQVSSQRTRGGAPGHYAYSEAVITEKHLHPEKACVQEPTVPPIPQPPLPFALPAKEGR